MAPGTWPENGQSPSQRPVLAFLWQPRAPARQAQAPAPPSNRHADGDGQAQPEPTGQEMAVGPDSSSGLDRSMGVAKMLPRTAKVGVAAAVGFAMFQPSRQSCTPNSGKS